ncbi:MAG: AtpZ/AtpI family protein [Rhodobiaceae bacterium]|nr:AtpZ/AtpI family protein [Rhodobiaceae bacterium]
MSDSDKPGSDAGKDRIDGGGDAELKARLNRLGNAIAGARAEAISERQAGPRDGKANSGIGQAVKLSSEFIAGVVVGGVLGYTLDYFAGTAPFGLIVLVLLGFAAGVRNLVRASQRMGGSQTDNDGDAGKDSR